MKYVVLARSNDDDTIVDSFGCFEKLRNAKRMLQQVKLDDPCMGCYYDYEEVDSQGSFADDPCDDGMYESYHRPNSRRLRESSGGNNGVLECLFKIVSAAFNNVKVPTQVVNLSSGFKVSTSFEYKYRQNQLDATYYVELITSKGGVSESHTFHDFNAYQDYMREIDSSYNK